METPEESSNHNTTLNNCYEINNNGIVLSNSLVPNSSYLPSFKDGELLRNPDSSEGS